MASEFPGVVFAKVNIDTGKVWVLQAHTHTHTPYRSYSTVSRIYRFSIIAQMIIEMRALWLVEN